MKFFRPSITLLVVAILAYGLLIPQLDFYWDDLPISWIRYQLGSEALTEYFSTNRPVWGLLYQLTTSIIPHDPIYWQVFALFWRWLGAVVVYAIVEKLWKDKPRTALGVSLLFLIYPGFNQQWAAFLYSHFFIVMFFFLFSFLCMLLAMEQPKRFWMWTSLGMIFSALNLWMMEYFYVLELARIGIIATALRGEPLTLRERVKRSLCLWSPYLAVFTLAVLSRLFIFNNQIYGIGLTDHLKSAPLETLKTLARSILFTLHLVFKDAWLQVTQLPNIASPESILNSYSLVVAAVVLVAIGGFLLLPREESKTIHRNLADTFWMISLGLFAVLLSGWPFWLIGFVPSLAWPASRFTLPFMFGVSLIFAGVISLIPWERFRIALLVSLISLAAGRQFLLANDYRQDSDSQRDMFWQLTWRAPGIKPDTTIIMNEGALEYYADNSLSPVVNWIYAPDNHGAHIDYVLLYPTTRLRSDALPKLEPGLPIFTDYLAGTFNGNTSQVLAVYFAPPGCLRILDPEVDRLNRSISEPSLMRFASRLTNFDLVTSEQTARMPDVYGPEPEHGFCYYFQKAELARQFKDWEKVVALGEIALMNQPNDPVERFVFIEGYAHVGEWERAVELSNLSFQESPEFVGPMLCRLWERVEAETTSSGESDVLTGEAVSKRGNALDEVRSLFACSP